MKHEMIETYRVADIYVELDWRDAADYAGDAKFIRIKGEATSAQASEVVDAIHKFRQKSKAFVVGNAVKVDGIVEIDELPETFEAAARFNVMKFVYEQLDDVERPIIEKLVGELE